MVIDAKAAAADISVVIPAYNEERRLKPFLDRVAAYAGQSPLRYEIIVVDDGSRDRTVDVVKAFEAQGVRLIRLEKNSGKGAAVKKGILEACGDIRLFMDADGSVDPDEIEKNLHFLKEGYDIVMGSRVLTSPDRKLEVKWYRRIIGKSFNLFVRFFLMGNYHDTQCGFKMFVKDAGRAIFSRTLLDGFGFDIEALFLAYRMGYKVKETPVSWSHRAGSKTSLVRDSIGMLFDIFKVRIWHWTPINPKNVYLGPHEYRFMFDMEKSHWWFVSRRRLVEWLVRGSLNPNLPQARILDVGCGTGMNMVLASRFGEVEGVDASPQAVAFCRQRGFTSVRCLDIEKIEGPSAQYDLILCLDVIEHLENPVAAFARFRSLLKTGGAIVVTTPAFRFLWSQHDQALCHYRRYRRSTLGREVKEAGLNVEKIGYFFFFSFLAVSPIRLARRLWWRHHKIQSDTTTLPPGFLNTMLIFLFRFEFQMVKRIPLPVGTTLYAVLRKL